MPLTTMKPHDEQTVIDTRKQRRKWMRKSVETLLLPEFSRRGFQPVPWNEEEAKSAWRTLVPFGRWRRRTSDGFEIIQVYFDPYGGPGFWIRFGAIPEGGTTDVFGNHLAAEDAWAEYLPVMYSTAPFRFFQAYCQQFKVRKWPWQSHTEADYVALVRRVIALMPDIETALREGRCGPHIRVVDMRTEAE